MSLVIRVVCSSDCIIDKFTFGADVNRIADTDPIHKINRHLFACAYVVHCKRTLLLS